MILFRVILATGFIHMLPAAMEALTDDSLPAGWKAYDAFAGLFAMLAAMVIQLIEYIAHQQYQSMHLNDDDHVGHSHGLAFQNPEAATKITTYILELGIAMHSVLIGLALGTATEEFVPLFIALCFHQFFEGMALGAQIARLKQISVCSAIIMVLFFAVTTPIGIGIGIGLQSSAYDPESVTSLLVSGILDSLSGGILIYTALVSLIATEMGPDATTFHGLSTQLKVWYFVALYTGAGAMAIVGMWA